MTLHEKIKESIEGHKNEIALLRKEKKAGYTIKVKESQVQLDKQKAKLAAHQKLYFQSVEPLKTAISGEQLRDRIIPAFGEALESIDITENNFHDLINSDEFGFPRKRDETADLMVEFLKNTGAMRLSKDGKNTRQDRSVKEWNEAADRVGNYIRTGDPNSTEEATSVSEVLERSDEIVNAVTSKEGDESLMRYLGFIPSDSMAVYAGLERALQESSHLARSSFTVAEDRHKLEALKNHVITNGSNIASQAGQSLRLKRTMDEYNGVYLARKGYENKIREWHKKDFGSVINIGWVDKFNAWIRSPVSRFAK